MAKELCIAHANCQGEPLIQRLLACPAFAERYEVRLVTNYVKEPMPEDALGRCSLFLYQHLGAKWGDLASERLLERLRPDARSLCIPNMFFKGYWPFWSGEPGFDYRCTHLDEFIDKGLPPEETVMLFLRSDVARLHDLDALAEASVEHERAREAHTPVKYVDEIVAGYGDEQLFNTVNHPKARLMNHAAAGVLKELEFEPPGQAALEALGEPFPEFEQPVNPKVAEHFGWEFGLASREYEVYGKKMGFAMYAANYIVARQAGVTDFIGFLQGANGEG